MLWERINVGDDFDQISSILPSSMPVISYALSDDP